MTSICRGHWELYITQLNALLPYSGTALLPPGGTVKPADPTRPLHLKFGPLMAYLAQHHRAAWGGKDEAECAAKMMKVCVMLGGGIELG